MGQSPSFQEGFSQVKKRKNPQLPCSTGPCLGRGTVANFHNLSEVSELCLDSVCFWEVQILSLLTGSTISTLLHDKINPKDCQVLSLGDSGLLQFFRVVSSDYGKPRLMMYILGKVCFSYFLAGT